MPEIELQRCPNCCCEANLYKTKKRRWRYAYTCGGCWTTTDLYDTPEAAARAWNRLEKRKPDRECLFCKHSMSGDAPDGSQVLVCFCCAGYEGKEVQADEVCENYSEVWHI